MITRPMITAPSCKQPNKLSQLYNTRLNLLTIVTTKWIEINFCKNGKGWRLPVVQSRKLINTAISHAVSRRWSDRGQYVGIFKEDTRHLYMDEMKYNGFSARSSGKMLSHSIYIWMAYAVHAFACEC